MSRLPDGLIAFGPQANCTLELCPIEWSVLRYQPSIPASGIFIALFALGLIVHAVQGIRWRTWGFMASMIAGCVLEIVGYVGRLFIHDNPFDFEGFLMQIICITIAPVFFSAAIYVLLSQTINFLDRSISRFSPRMYYWTFIPLDVVSLVLQAVGGALSSVSTTIEAVDRGVNISLAGLVLQVASMLVFCSLFADYIATYTRSRTRPPMGPRLKVFLLFLGLGTLFILLRCVYRIVELHEGYFSHWFRDQTLFIALESAVMVLAVFSLSIGHPGLAFNRREGGKPGAINFQGASRGEMTDSVQMNSANKGERDRN
ncbi:Parasitic phase-specific protein PSP-1 [Colletotrichum higginsianum IMI 349063]|uniref:Parasitic phase-specific protein PSP-1 n=3 Tax=Colletotrichum higginsianum TaxID=80884 RepID=A0A1B7Y943_COLHI|nr:Parasitic phase-specific protein PSP-1 [Colletotrichum higginsianum IMI 349063]OBR08576.1 Parasitic phase-specific protein PSP-1 [Colletotrichum higginsianum IMI 349063]TIC95272.1 Sphingoid long-chain base transporter RSB1 [Colletotrichum higginsianum]